MLLSGSVTAALLESAKSGHRTVHMVAVGVDIEHADVGMVLACRRELALCKALQTWLHS